VQVSDAGMTRHPRAAAAGVRKAPRHEIAGSGAPAVLRGYGDLAAVRDLSAAYNFSKGVLASKACTTLAFWHKYWLTGESRFSLPM